MATGRFACATFALLLACVGQAGAQSTAFTYQGELNQGGQPANGQYDFQFALFDTDDFLETAPFAGPINVLDQDVTAGNFTAELDFGPGVFGGQDLWLEIRVREAGDPGPLTALSPRQRVAAVPLALVATEAFSAVSAQQADVAEIANGVLPDSIGIDEIDPNEVQARVIQSCDPGWSIRGIRSDGSVSCELDTVGGGDNVYLFGTVYAADEQPNDGSQFESVEGPSAGGTACFLTRVRMSDVDVSNEETGCRVYVSGGRWLLQAEAEGDSYAYCEMRCIGGL